VTAASGVQSMNEDYLNVKLSQFSQFERQTLAVQSVCRVREVTILSMV
jgi:hypothetical protein